MKLSQLCAEFLLAGEVERGYAQNTLRNYRGHSRRLIKALGDADIHQISTGDLRTCLAGQQHSRGLCPKSIYQVVAHLRALFGFAVEQGYLAESPAKRIRYPKTPRGVPRPIPQDDLAKLLTTWPKFYNEGSFWQLRDRTLLHTAAFTGARRAEVRSMDCCDVDLGRCEVIIRQGKGGKDRIVPIPGTLADLLETYLLRRVGIVSLADEPALFVSWHKTRVCFSTIGNIFCRHAKYCGVDSRYTFHSLRHSYATCLLRGGASLLHIQKLLGHKNIETTQIYLGVTTEDLRQAVERHPLLAVLEH